MDIQIRLFGPFEISLRNRPINFARRKSKGLLAYLLLHPRQHTREKLATLFWGDSTESDARRALRVSLAELRASLGEHVILAEQDWIRANPSLEADMDTHAFSLIAKWTPEHGLPALKDALSLYRGELLEEFYDDWIFPLREKYHSLCIGGLLKGADLCRANSDYPQAIELAQRAIALESTNESAHQHLMVCHAAQDNLDLALRQYETLKRKLMEELGTTPSAAVQKLHGTLLERRAQSSAAHLTNLPQWMTSFIGRQAEMERLTATLSRHIHRPCLVTLTGTGGVGKSRLALETARRLLSQYADGVWWADLSPVQDAAGVTQTVAKVVGAKEKARLTPQETVAQALRDRSALLILDNCEHQLEPCAALLEVLTQDCPHLHVLVTSREPLGLSNEHIQAVHSMPMPSPSEAGYPVLAGNEAVRLFAERAAMRQPPFHVSEDNAAIIAEICQRLDGLPLAIELAATQVHTLGLDEIKQQLRKRLSLGGQTQGRAKRHVSLRDMISWSYGLLNETEQSLFRRLSVFAEHWTEEQSIVIAGGYVDGSARLTPPADPESAPLPVSAQTVVRATLASLAAKSLLGIRRSGEVNRYTMLDTIRQFAQEKLGASKEAEVARARHSRYFLQETARLWKDAHSPRENAALDTLESDYANLRAALAFAVRQKSTAWNGRSFDMLGRFWSIRNSATEGRAWFERFLRHPGLRPRDDTRGTALLQAGLIAWDQGDFPSAARYYEEARSIFEETGNILSLSTTLNNHGNLYLHEEHFAKARGYYEQSLSLARQTGNERAIGYALNNLALTLSELNEKEQARALLEEGLELRKKAGDQRGLGIVLNNLGDLVAEAGDLAQAKKYYNQALQLRASVGDKRGVISPLGNLINISILRGRNWQANAALLGFTDAVIEQTGIRLSLEARRAFEKFHTAIREKLGADFEAAYQAGKALSLAEAVKLAGR